MKKSFFLGFIALATLTMMSCSNDETTAALYEDNAIEFGTYAGRTPQKAPGKETTTATVESDGFGVSAVYTGQANYSGTLKPNFMYNQLVDKKTDTWAYSPVKYWPTTQGDKLSFFAYAPHNASNVTLTGEAGDPTTLTYKLNDTGANEDFVAAALYNVTAGKTTPEVVKFVFNHELTRLSIQARANDDTKGTNNPLENETHVVIKSMTFDGTAKFPTEATYKYDAKNYAAGSHGTWTPTATSTDYKIGTALANDNEVKLGNKTPQYTQAGIDLTGNTLVNLLDLDTPYLFLLPPNGTTGIAAAGDIKVTFEYDIVTVDDALELGYSITSAKKTVELPAAILKQGVAYNLTFVFGLDQVVVSATVESWGTPVDDAENIVDWADPVLIQSN